MNKTLNINLGGFIFHIDENAFYKLERYLETLKIQFKSTEGGSEIINDIEVRIAELFKDRTGPAKDVISLTDVEEVIGIMGEPEDYLDADEEPKKQNSHSYKSNSKRIFRDPDNSMIGGVASGLAAYWNTEPTWIRLLFLALMFSGFGFLFYIIMWVVIPKAKTTAEKLQMRGAHVNVSNIEKSIKDDLGNIGNNVKDFAKKATEYDFKKHNNQIGDLFSRIGDFIIESFRLIFRLIGKLFGFFFLLIGFLILISLVIGMFAGSVEFIGSGYGISDFFDWIELVTIGQNHYNLILAGLILATIAPFFLIIYLGIRLIFNLDPLNKPTRSALTVTTVIGLALLITGSVKAGLQFDRNAHITETVDLPSHSHYHLKVLEDTIARTYLNDFSSDWLQTNNKNAFSFVELDIKQAPGNEAYLKIITEAQGPNRKEARKNTADVIMEYKITDSIIEVPLYYLLRQNTRFRGQEINISLYLPAGSSVYLDETMADIIYDIDNISNEWDWDMIGRTWEMTPHGLNCQGCDLPSQYLEEETETDSSNTSPKETEPVQKSKDTISENQQLAALIPLSNNFKITI